MLFHDLPLPLVQLDLALMFPSRAILWEQARPMLPMRVDFGISDPYDASNLMLLTGLTAEMASVHSSRIEG
ncbi:MAG TPA: hypothetical protein VGL18_15310 [Actinomycetota bacterium]|jgi:hypothetical protein